MAAWTEPVQEQFDIFPNEYLDQAPPAPPALLRGMVWGFIFSVPIWGFIWLVVMR